MTRQTPEESSQVIAEAASEITAFLQEKHPKLLKPEAIRATAILIGLITDWIKENEELQQEIDQLLEEIVNEGN